MKKLLYILLFNISAISFAQDPQLFENDWYLYEVLSNDMGTLYDVSLIEPPIAPYLTISEDLNFNGLGACNTFSGVYEFFPSNELSSLNFITTTNDCGIQQHNSFEDEYFQFADVALKPCPVRRIPIWYGGGTPAACRRAPAGRSRPAGAEGHDLLDHHAGQRRRSGAAGGPSCGPRR